MRGAMHHAPCAAHVRHHVRHHVMHHVRQAPLCLKQLGARLVAIRPEMSVAHRGLVRALPLLRLGTALERMPTHTHALTRNSAGCWRPATHCIACRVASWAHGVAAWVHSKCMGPPHLIAHGRRCLRRPRLTPSSSLPTAARPPCSDGDSPLGGATARQPGLRARNHSSAAGITGSGRPYARRARPAQISRRGRPSALCLLPLSPLALTLCRPLHPRP